MSEDTVPVEVRAQFAELFEACHRLELIELGERDIALTPLGAQCLDEILMYLAGHPRADVAARSARLRDAIHAKRSRS